MKIIIEKDKNILIGQAIRKLQDLFIKNKDKPILFLTSGGSSFDLLSGLEIPSVNISLGVLDERYSEDPKINNFLQLKSTAFYARSANLFDQILDTSVHEEESLEQFTDRFESLLKGWRTQHPDGVIIATTGMGPDGHISGMMPYPENGILFEGMFNDPGNWVAGYDAGNKNPYNKRATTTMPFLRGQVDCAVSYITGENKRDALARLFADKGELNETPARILHELKNTTIFTDVNVNS